MLDLGIRKADFTWLILKAKAGKLVASEFLETPVGQQSSLPRHKPRLAALHEKRRVLDRHPFRQVRVVGESTAAITDREDRRDHLEMVSLAGLSDLVQPTKVIGGFLAESIQAEGDDGAVAAVLARSIEYTGNLRYVAVLTQPPSRSPYKSVGVGFGSVKMTREAGQSDEEACWFHRATSLPLNQKRGSEKPSCLPHGVAHVSQGLAVQLPAVILPLK